MWLQRTRRVLHYLCSTHRSLYVSEHCEGTEPTAVAHHLCAPLVGHSLHPLSWPRPPAVQSAMQSITTLTMHAWQWVVYKHSTQPSGISIAVTQRSHNCISCGCYNLHRMLKHREQVTALTSRYQQRSPTVHTLADREADSERGGMHQYSQWV